VFGASVLLAEGASQKPQNGIRTRGSQGPDDSLGHGGHMEHPGGAFKANSAHLPAQLKNCSPKRFPTLVSNSNDQNTCKKFSQNLACE
jgi:hypothetical protein